MAADPMLVRRGHSVAVSQSNLMSAGLCRLLSQVFQEAAMLLKKMLRRALFAAVFGLGLSGCYYYAGGYDVYSTPYYYPGYYSPYYYGYYGPRYYGGYRAFYYGGHGYSRGHGYYGGGHHGGGYRGGHR